MIDACPDSAVLFFDVDGTLTSFDPDNLTDKDLTAIRPSRAVIDSFRKLRDAGHKAFICTGRPLWLIADGLRALDPEGIVAMGGATLEIEGHMVHEDCIDEGVVGVLARRMAALDAGEDGFVPYGCIVSEGKVPAVVGTGEVPVFAIIAPELLEGIGSPLRELLGSVCAAA